MRLKKQLTIQRRQLRAVRLKELKCSLEQCRGRELDEARCDAGGAGNSSMISLQSCDYSKGGEMFDFIPPEHHIETFVSCNIGANLLFLPCSFDLLRL
jgi:hypothetical protein